MQCQRGRRFRGSGEGGRGLTTFGGAAASHAPHPPLLDLAQKSARGLRGAVPLDTQVPARLRVRVHRAREHKEQHTYLFLQENVLLHQFHLGQHGGKELILKRWWRVAAAVRVDAKPAVVVICHAILIMMTRPAPVGRGGQMVQCVTGGEGLV